MATDAGVASPRILHLKIERFRGIKYLDWHPGPGLNVLLGGGDVGKTTILDAIAWLFSPTSTPLVTDPDFWHREIANGFKIEAVLSLPEDCGINQQSKNAWPWEWDGQEAKVPDIERQPIGEIGLAPAYRVSVRGTEELEAIYEVIQPDLTTINFSASVRQRIGLVRLSGDDRNDREFRLIKGSALDRLLADKTLRARLGQRLAEGEIDPSLTEDAKSCLKDLDKGFQNNNLPTGLGLGFTGSPGVSINAFIGLMATKDGVKLPLTSWGAGTRRLAALQIASAQQGEKPFIVVDEVERALEPYRLRVLVATLQDCDSQVFLTTHSPVALSAASKASIWFMTSDGTLSQLPPRTAVLVDRDPEAFLSRITVIAEGATEVGFVKSLVKRAIGTDFLNQGIWITDGQGNESTLNLLEALTSSGLSFAGIADNEGTDPTRWRALKARLGDRLFRWERGCIEENIISLVPMDRIEEFIANPDEESGDRRRTLAVRLGLPDKDFRTILDRSTDVRRLVIEAATGFIPDDKQEAEPSEKKALKKHAQQWFKSEEGGVELGEKLFAFGIWPNVKDQLLPFLNAIRGAISLPNIIDLQR